jgi:hypothetical protein
MSIFFIGTEADYLPTFARVIGIHETVVRMDGKIIQPFFITKTKWNVHFWMSLMCSLCRL